MKYEVFEKIIIDLKEIQSKSYEFYKLGLDLSNILEDDYCKIINNLFCAHYSEEGYEWISWFLYERESISGKINDAEDEDGNPICYDIKSTWELVEKIRKSKKFKEYQLKKNLTEKERLEIIKKLFEK